MLLFEKILSPRPRGIDLNAVLAKIMDNNTAVEGLRKL